MPLPERLTKAQIKEKFLDPVQIENFYQRIDVNIYLSQLDDIMDECYNQGALCQHSSHGNRVGHFEEFVGTKTKES
jgi:hypothetical protein